MLGGGAEKEGKVFMRGSADTKGQLEIGGLISRLNKKAVKQVYTVSPVGSLS